MSKLCRLLILKYCHNRTLFNLLKSRSILTRLTFEKIRDLTLIEIHNYQYLSIFDYINKYCLKNDQIRLACFLHYHRERLIDYDWGLAGACQGGHRELIDFMIIKGATNWNLALYWACKSGRREMVDLMIVKGATNLNQGLRISCMRGHQELIDLMIVKGANWCDHCHKSLNKHRKENN